MVCEIQDKQAFLACFFPDWDAPRSVYRRKNVEKRKSDREVPFSGQFVAAPAAFLDSDFAPSPLGSELRRESGWGSSFRNSVLPCDGSDVQTSASVVDLILVPIACSADACSQAGYITENKSTASSPIRANRGLSRHFCQFCHFYHAPAKNELARCMSPRPVQQTHSVKSR